MLIPVLTDQQNALPTQRGGAEAALMADIVLPKPFDARKQGSFTQAWQENLHHYTRGNLLVSVSSQKPAGVVSFGCNVQIFGVVGGQPVVVATGFVSGSTPPLRYLIGESDTFTEMLVKVQQVVNGLPDSSQDSQQLDVQVTGRVYR